MELGPTDFIRFLAIFPIFRRKFGVFGPIHKIFVDKNITRMTTSISSETQTIYYEIFKWTKCIYKSRLTVIITKKRKRHMQINMQKLKITKP